MECTHRACGKSKFPSNNAVALNTPPEKRWNLGAEVEGQIR